MNLHYKFAIASLGILLGFSGCNESGQATFEAKLARHTAQLRSSDGSWHFYAGKGIADKVANGQRMDAQDPEQHMLISVPDSIVNPVATRNKSVVTLSLEDPSTKIEITIHRPRPNSQPPVMEDLHFKAGDPWISGYAQVVADGTRTLALFDLIEWLPPISPTGSISANFYSTGGVVDANAPALKYGSDNATKWPALPSHWDKRANRWPAGKGWSQ